MRCFMHNIPQGRKVICVLRTRHPYGIAVEERLVRVGRCVDCGEYKPDWIGGWVLKKKYVIWYKNKKGESFNKAEPTAEEEEK